MTNTIKIKCNAENTLELTELTEFQGGLKQRTDIDYDKIKLSKLTKKANLFQSVGKCTNLVIVFYCAATPQTPRTWRAYSAD